jgi:hypothetical protein
MKDRAARYFVGNYVGDPHARTMVQAYADACRGDDPQLADDLEAELADSAADFERFGVGHRCSDPASPHRCSPTCTHPNRDPSLVYNDQPPTHRPPRWAVPTGWTAPRPYSARTDYDRDEWTT